MARGGKVDFKELKKFQKQLEKFADKEVNEFLEACSKELAARLLAKVIKRTPVGDYTKEIEVVAKRDSKKHNKGDTYKKTVNVGNKKGGTARRGWTANKKANASAYVDTIVVNHFGDTYVIEIINPVEYISYLEYGHRTRNGKGWVTGKFMLTISEREIQGDAPKILEAKLKKFMEGCCK